MIRSRFDWSVVLGLAGVVVLLIVNAVLSHSNVWQLNEDARWVAHTHEVIDTLEEARGHLLESETIQRTYLIVGGDARPPAFTESVNAAKERIGLVKRLTEDNSDQQARIPDLQKRMTEFTTALSRAAAARKAQGFDAAREVAEIARSEQALAELQGLIRQMVDAERVLLTNRQGKTAKTYSFAIVTGILTAAIGLAAVGMFTWLLDRHLWSRQRATAEIHGQRQILQATLASIGDGVIATDIHGRVTFLNDVARHLTGWSLDEALGRPLDEVFHIVNEDTRTTAENPALRALAEGNVVGLANHTILIARDGTEWPLDDSAAPIRDGAGAVSGAILVFREVSERRRWEKELSSRVAASRLLASIVESSEDVIVAKSLDGIIQSWNAAAERILGYTAAEAIGRHITLVIPADRMVEEEQIIARIRAGERVEHIETVRRRKDGQCILLSLTVSPIKDEAGRVVGASKIARDITDQKRAEGRLRDERERFQTTLASIGDGVITSDTEGRVTFLNPVAETLTGWSQEAACGMPLATVFNIVLEHSRRSADDSVTNAIRENRIAQSTNQTVLIARDGTERPISNSVSPIRDANGNVTGVVLVFRDTTERRRADQADRRTKEILQLVHKIGKIGHWEWNVVTDENQWSPEIEALYGLPPGGFTGGYESWAKMLHPDDLGKAQADVRRAFETGEYFTEFRVIWPDGSIHWLETRASLLKEDDGKPVRMVGVNMDITERKRIEEDLRHSQLELQKRVEQLAEMDRRKDEFLATLAHELRNPLAPIRNGLHVMRVAAGDPNAVESARAMMDRQLAQLARLVDDLMDVSRISRGMIELRREHVLLAAVVESAVETSRPLIDQMQHHLAVTLPKQPLAVNADLTRLAQVFSNLLNNAAKYTDPGGRIWLTAERHGSDVVVSIRDTGIGIAADQLSRIFEMFSQADRALDKAQGGLGIGLTLVKRLVEMHGGAIEAKSQGVGAGAEFVVRLPIVVEASRALPADKDADAAAVGSSLRILIVDDNRDGADSLSVMLKMMGNVTRTAYDGEEAVAAAIEFRPNVVLLDIGLPKLTGYDACRRIRQEPGGAGMVIIAQTGWGQEENRQQTRAAGFDHHLVKPVDPQTLTKLLAGLQTRNA